MSPRPRFAVYEKEGWLYRGLNGKRIVFPDSLLEVKQTLSHGEDVAFAISKLICNDKAYGEIVHIAGAKALSWGEVLNIYVDILEEHLDRKITICHIPDALELTEKLGGGKYQLKYARGISREFDNSKLRTIIGDMEFRDFRRGARQCLDAFFDTYNEERLAHMQLALGWRKEAYLDKLTGDYAGIREYKSLKHTICYWVRRLFIK